MQTNSIVREAAKSAGIPLWKIAAELGISEATIIRWLRVRLSPEKERRIMDAIHKMGREAG